MYKKWLHDYLDVCRKDHFPQKQKESLPHFLKKLQDKRQTKAQQEQAVQAVTLYYELLDAKAPSKSTEQPPASPQWENQYFVLAGAIISPLRKEASRRIGIQPHFLLKNI
jgi:hypothetical protein